MRSRTAAGTAPPRRRLNTLDDVIVTGEIAERRSLVVRSSTQAIHWNDEPTEVSIRPLATRPTHGWRALWLLAAIACGAAAIVLVLRTRPGVAHTPALEARAELIGTTLDGEARAALVRVEAIATAPVLRASIETDARTVADLIRSNGQVLPVKRGEVVELFQIRDGRRTLLARVPADAPALAVPAESTRIDARNHGVVVVAKAEIAQQPSGAAGEIVLAVPVDLAPVARRIAEHTSSAVLAGLGEPIALVDGGVTPNVTIPITMKSPVAGSLSLVAAVPRPPSRTAAWACMAGSILLLSIFAVSVVRGRRAHIA